MPLMTLQSDKEKISKQHPVYWKGGSHKGGTLRSDSYALPYKSLNNRQLFHKKDGGFLGIDFGSIAKIIIDNKDLIKDGVSAVANVADAVKGISDAVKSSKELEKIKEIRKHNVGKKGENKQHAFTPEQLEILSNIKKGEGFKKF